jgi:hypothetical protein
MFPMAKDILFSPIREEKFPIESKQKFLMKNNTICIICFFNPEIIDSIKYVW